MLPPIRMMNKVIQAVSRNFVMENIFDLGGLLVFHDLSSRYAISE
jgi:hypothetical protein